MALPVLALTIAYLLVIATTDGAGSAIGFRAIFTMVLFPLVVLVTVAVNYVIAYKPFKSPSWAFSRGMIVPAIGVVLEYAYLWQIWEKYPSIS